LILIESVVLRNTELDTEISINKTTGEYWLDEVDFGQVEGTNHSYKFIDQVGETVYNTTLEPRQIQITGYVAGWDAISVSQMKKRLNRLVNPKHLLEAYANGKKIQFYPRTSVAYSVTYQENNELISKFLVTGYCPYPMFTDADEQNVLVSYTKHLFHFPLIIPEGEGIQMGVRQPSQIAEVTNEGDLPVGYIVEFKAYGTVVNPSLTDIETQTFIQINKTMTVGEVIRVDTREGYRKVTGSVNGEESNYFQYRTFDSSWLTLGQGLNYIQYDAESGLDALEINIRFEPGYLEVDE
jgi:hypothetical protein